MTKMMTVYLVYEAIANGEIGFDSVFSVSKDAYEMSLRSDLSNVPLSLTVSYTVDELLDVAIVMSACGATAALADFVAGSRSGFLAMMNDKAKEWGIDAKFTSTMGGTTLTQMTPRAMAEITRHTLLDYPQVLEKTSLKSVTFQGRKYASTNELLGVYEGIDGFKTGTHSDVGENFAGTAQRGDIRIITVTMGSSSNRRFRDTRVLLDYGFATMEALRLEELEARKVSPTVSTITVNETEIELESYSIDGNDFFALWDISRVLEGTIAQFDYDRDEESDTITLKRGQPQFDSGGDITYSQGDRALPVPIVSKITLDGEEESFTAYDIGGLVYFLPGELGKALGFDVFMKWDSETDNNTISITVEPLPDEETVQVPEVEIEGDPKLPEAESLIEADNLPESVVPDREGRRSLLPVIVLCGLGVLVILCVVCILADKKRRARLPAKTASIQSLTKRSKK